MNVLFLCTGNSCRSIMAEAIFNQYAPEGWRAMSAGSRPAGQPNPRATALLEKKGVSTQGLYSKSWAELESLPDIVITLCASAAKEPCPAYLGDLLRVNWSMPDPAEVVGDAAQVEAAYEAAFDVLSARIAAFLTQDISAMQGQPARVGRALRDIVADLVPQRLEFSGVHASSAGVIQVFDPALCCSTGVCRVEVDEALVKFAADVEWAKQRGVAIQRFNLAQQPMAFAANPIVAKALEAQGQAALPLVLLNGKIAMSGRYPGREELSQWAGPPQRLRPPMIPNTQAQHSNGKSCCGSGGDSSGAGGCKCC